MAVIMWPISPNQPHSTLTDTSGTNTGNHHWNSTLAACAPSSRHVSCLHVPWLPLFHLEPVPTPRVRLPPKRGGRLLLSV
jgi:hypothetical protein